MRTAVIGTSGQLALELHRAPRSGHVELLPAERVDLSDTAALKAWLDRVKPGLILNAAAYTAVDRAELETERAFEVNASGPGALATWAAHNGAALFQVSTDYVFDGSKTTGYVESDQTGPLNAYGQSKLAGELAVRRALPRHLILRTSWLFSSHGQNFVKTMLRLAAERPELRVVADQHGCPTPAAELARAMLSLAARFAGGEELRWGTYHFAGAGPTTWRDFAEATVALRATRTGSRPVVTGIPSSEYPTPARRPTYSILDTSRFTRTFGIACEPWQAGLRHVVAELLGGVG